MYHWAGAKQAKKSLHLCLAKCSHADKGAILNLFLYLLNDATSCQTATELNVCSFIYTIGWNHHILER